MTKRECMEVEALSLIQRADPDTIKTLLKLLKLGVRSSGFKAAFAGATPPGEKHPPIDVLKALLDEWSRKECL